MAIIGMFTPTKEGGWAGSIRTLVINAKIRLVLNDNRHSDQAPDFRVFIGIYEAGAAWRKRTRGENPREYVSMRLDDPSLPGPIFPAIFISPDGAEARVVWNRESQSENVE